MLAILYSFILLDIFSNVSIPGVLYAIVITWALVSLAYREIIEQIA
jgi:hypothetical protein